VISLDGEALLDFAMVVIQMSSLINARTSNRRGVEIENLVSERRVTFSQHLRWKQHLKASGNTKLKKWKFYLDQNKRRVWNSHSADRTKLVICYMCFMSACAVYYTPCWKSKLLRRSASQWCKHVLNFLMLNLLLFAYMHLRAHQQTFVYSFE
jgi:hypothetical protein